MKLGSVAAGGVILSLLVTTGYMYYKDREARATVPKTPPIDAMVLQLKKVDPYVFPWLLFRRRRLRYQLMLLQLHLTWLHRQHRRNKS